MDIRLHLQADQNNPGTGCMYNCTYRFQSPGGQFCCDKQTADQTGIGSSMYRTSVSAGMGCSPRTFSLRILSFVFSLLKDIQYFSHKYVYFVKQKFAQVKSILYQLRLHITFFYKYKLYFKSIIYLDFIYHS